MAAKSKKCTRPGVCRKHRPNCWFCRQATVCRCSGFVGKRSKNSKKADSHMPHRKGSRGAGLGACEHHPDHYELMMQIMTTPVRKTG